MTTITLSIEETEGSSRQHGFHLGTQMPLARQIAEEKLAAMVKHSMPVVSLALIQNRKIIDVLYADGHWHSQEGYEEPTEYCNC